MTEPMKIKVDFDSETTQILLNFISDTQEGKFTEKKPDLAQITYTRMQIQEQDSSFFVDDGDGEVLLFGVSY